jgi:zinc protease
MRIHQAAAVVCAAVILMAACGSGTAEAPPIFPYAHEIHDFDNGLRLVTVNSGYPNIVSLYVVVNVGSRNEVEPGRSGFAHLFEHVMFRGTEKNPPEAWQAVMEGAGASTNAYTSDDRTVYHATFSKEDLEKILELEADRFQNLSYSEEVFKTETRAVLSEYNKNFSNPFRKLDEGMRNAIFSNHTYKHTTMGFVEDVENMPAMYDYGLQFFDRYYRPEYTTVTVVGDTDFDATRAMVEKYWGVWERGSYESEIPVDPPQSESKRVDLTFQAPTLPFLAVSFQAPAYDDEVIDSAVMDLISFHSFGENSDLYKKLVIEEQKVDAVMPSYPDHRDPYPFSVIARVKDEADVPYVEQQILETFERVKNTPIPADELDAVKSHLRYQFALGMDSTESIAQTLAHYLSLRRTPETINKRYKLYAGVRAEDVQAVAKKYFVETARTVSVLTYQPGDKGNGDD